MFSDLGRSEPLCYGRISPPHHFECPGGHGGRRHRGLCQRWCGGSTRAVPVPLCHTASPGLSFGLLRTGKTRRGWSLSREGSGAQSCRGAPVAFPQLLSSITWDATGESVLFILPNPFFALLVFHGLCHCRRLFILYSASLRSAVCVFVPCEKKRTILVLSVTLNCPAGKADVVILH